MVRAAVHLAVKKPPEGGFFTETAINAGLITS
jgi:hypothetical protein